MVSFGSSQTLPLSVLPNLPPPEPVHLPEVEPGLIEALQELPERQRTAVWLVVGCGWTHGEAGAAMDAAPSTVSTHVSRGVGALRRAIGGDLDD